MTNFGFGFTQAVVLIAAAALLFHDANNNMWGMLTGLCVAVLGIGLAIPAATHLKVTSPPAA